MAHRTTTPGPASTHAHTHTHTNMSEQWYARHAYATQRMISIHSVWAELPTVWYTLRGSKCATPAPHKQPPPLHTFSQSESRWRATCFQPAPHHAAYILNHGSGIPCRSLMWDVSSLWWGLYIKVVRFQRDVTGLNSTGKRCFHSRVSKPLQRDFCPGWPQVCHSSTAMERN